MTCIGSARILWVLNNLDPDLYYNSQSKYFINHFIESGIFESQNGFLWKLRIVPPSQNNKNEYTSNKLIYQKVHLIACPNKQEI